MSNFVAIRLWMFYYRDIHKPPLIITNINIKRDLDSDKYYYLLSNEQFEICNDTIYARYLYLNHSSGSQTFYDLYVPRGSDIYLSHTKSITDV